MSKKVKRFKHTFIGILSATIIVGMIPVVSLPISAETQTIFEKVRV